MSIAQEEKKTAFVIEEKIRKERRKINLVADKIAQRKEKDLHLTNRLQKSKRKIRKMEKQLHKIGDSNNLKQQKSEVLINDAVAQTVADHFEYQKEAAESPNKKMPSENEQNAKSVKSADIDNRNVQTSDDVKDKHSDDKTVYSEKTAESDAVKSSSNESHYVEKQPDAILKKHEALDEQSRKKINAAVDRLNVEEKDSAEEVAARITARKAEAKKKRNEKQQNTDAQKLSQTERKQKNSPAGTKKNQKKHSNRQGWNHKKQNNGNYTQNRQENNRRPERIRQVNRSTGKRSWQAIPTRREG